jgi:DNA polymerase-1
MQTRERDAAEIARLILRSRTLKKQISTYYDSTEELIYDDGCVHAQFNHADTDTGRLASKLPNLQNQPSKEASKVKEHFISRFENGVLIQTDYSQIDLCTQAQISGDENYIKDVTNKIDMHIKRLSLKEKLPYEEIYQKIKIEKDEAWSYKRKKAKEFSFQRAFGARPESISEKTGLSVPEVEKLIQSENKEYPRLALYNQYLEELVNKQGFYTGFTGRIYRFRRRLPKYLIPKAVRDKGKSAIIQYVKTLSPDYMKKHGRYRDPEIKARIVQGTATGDIVLIMIGKFFREKAIYNRHKYLLINTVHDDLMLDCKGLWIKDAQKDLQLLKEVATMAKEEFNYEWKVPIEIEISSGQRWQDL